MGDKEYGYDIKPVPLHMRKYGLLDNFAIWFGAGISIAEFWAGAILVASPLSLNLKLALIAIIVGHLIGNLLLSM
ncbi:MAG: cytosine permease, partial [Staphylothermus sp.]|nr:cytosine permease [Staphylothermus sp.]